MKSKQDKLAIANAEIKRLKRMNTRQKAEIKELRWMYESKLFYNMLKDHLVVLTDEG